MADCRHRDDWEPERKRCTPCRDRANRLNVARQNARQAAGLCVLDGQRPLDPDSVMHCTEHMTARRRYAREYARRLRITAWEQYGGAFCACCGEDEHNFLTIDHVNDDGADHRREIGEKNNAFYSWLKRHDYPPGYRVMCANCNQGRWRNGGTCPHQEKMLRVVS